MAWEVVTEVYKLPKSRLYISVFNDDSEAADIWADRVGLARDHILYMGEEDNFWMSGPTGEWSGTAMKLY